MPKRRIERNLEGTWNAIIETMQKEGEATPQTYQPTTRVETGEGGGKQRNERPCNVPQTSATPETQMRRLSTSTMVIKRNGTSYTLWLEVWYAAHRAIYIYVMRIQTT